MNRGLPSPEMRCDRRVGQTTFSRKLLEGVTGLSKQLTNLLASHHLTNAFSRIRKRFSVFERVGLQLFKFSRAPHPIRFQCVPKLLKNESMRSDQDGKLLHGIALFVIRLLQHTFCGLGRLECGTQESDGGGTLRRSEERRGGEECGSW